MALSYRDVKHIGKLYRKLYDTQPSVSVDVHEVATGVVDDTHDNDEPPPNLRFSHQINTACQNVDLIPIEHEVDPARQLNATQSNFFILHAPGPHAELEYLLNNPNLDNDPYKISNEFEQEMYKHFPHLQPRASTQSEIDTSVKTSDLPNPKKRLYETITPSPQRPPSSSLAPDTRVPVKSHSNQVCAEYEHKKSDDEPADAEPLIGPFEHLCLHTDSKKMLNRMLSYMVDTQKRIVDHARELREAAMEFHAMSLSWCQQGASGQWIDNRAPALPNILSLPPLTPFAPFMWIGPSGIGKYASLKALASVTHFDITELNWAKVLLTMERVDFKSIAARASSNSANPVEHLHGMDIFAAKVVAATELLIITAMQKQLAFTFDTSPCKIIVVRHLEEVFDAIHQHSRYAELLMNIVCERLLVASSDFFTIFISSDLQHYHMRLMKTKIKQMQNDRARQHSIQNYHLSAVFKFKPPSTIDRRIFIQHYFKYSPTSQQNAMHAPDRWCVPEIARPWVPVEFLQHTPCLYAIESCHSGDMRQLFIQIYMSECLHRWRERRNDRNSPYHSMQQQRQSAITAPSSSMNTHSSSDPLEIRGNTRVSCVATDRTVHGYHDTAFDASNMLQAVHADLRALQQASHDAPLTQLATMASFFDTPIQNLFDACHFILRSDTIVVHEKGVANDHQIINPHLVFAIQSIIQKFQLYHQLRYNLINFVIDTKPSNLYCHARWKMLIRVFQLASLIDRVDTIQRWTRDAKRDVDAWKTDLLARLTLLYKSSDFGSKFIPTPFRTELQIFQRALHGDAQMHINFPFTHMATPDVRRSTHEKYPHIGWVGREKYHRPNRDDKLYYRRFDNATSEQQSPLRYASKLDFSWESKIREMRK